MRNESEIFRDLSALCMSDGYVHALAILCFRDSVIGFSEEMSAEDMKHLFSMERLIRTETSTLIGLMVQQKITLAPPDSDVLQQYIDRTEKLLKEFHEAMLEPTANALRTAMQNGETANPFKKGELLREPIFYGGESAYAFQFRDISVPKYQADDDWLKKNKGFSIQRARDVVHALVKLQNSKFTETLNSLPELPPEEWTLLPSFTFTPAELSKNSGFDQLLVENVLNAFVLPPDERNSSFRAIHDFNVVTALPIIPLCDGRLLLLEQYSLEQSLYESPFYWMRDDLAYLNTAVKHRGQFVESFSRARLESVFGEEAVYQNVRIPGAKGKDVGEIDTLVLFGGRAIIVQAKSKRLTLEARKGNDNLIRDDFKKSVQESYRQALSCARVLTAPNPRLLDAAGKRIKIPDALKEIYVFCVVADHYPALSFQSHQFLEYEAVGAIQPPFVMDIFTLDAIAEMLDAPLFFLSYINRRATYQEIIHAEHELTILSYHLKRNLWFEKDYDFVQLNDEIIADLDVAMTVRREGTPGKRTPDGILTRLKETRVGKIVAHIESHPDPGVVDLGFALLKLSEDTVIKLSNLIDRMADRSRADGLHHDLTFPMGMIGEGLTIHCNTYPIPMAEKRLGGHCSLRKYKAKAARWFGICLGPDASVRFGVNLDYEWKGDPKMDDLVMQSLRPGQAIDMDDPKRGRKIGRNDQCPCGSGRKYKKCCL